ncbi:hypothetical protein Tco_1028954 [Tanacetum coccineum]|uniref:Uncharacterized protein n=1 Tax=Tanacetum coccineum TaxID=301880 RepID=A0ABQ5G3K6_9ASTR
MHDDDDPLMYVDPGGVLQIGYEVEDDDVHVSFKEVNHLGRKLKCYTTCLEAGNTTSLDLAVIVGRKVTGYAWMTMSIAHEVAASELKAIADARTTSMEGLGLSVVGDVHVSVASIGPLFSGTVMYANFVYLYLKPLQQFVN